MRPYDDRVPEEQDPQYEELITFLQHANLSPKLVDPTLRTQFLSQVRARLMQTDSGASLPEDLSEPEMQELGSLPSKPKVRRGKQYQRGRVVQLLNAFAAVLVVTALLVALLLLYRHRLPSTGNHITNATQTYASFVAKNGIMFGFDPSTPMPIRLSRYSIPTNVGKLKEKWAYHTRYLVASSPAVVGGVVYVGSGDHNLYAFHLPGR